MTVVHDVYRLKRGVGIGLVVSSLRQRAHRSSRLCSRRLSHANSGQLLSGPQGLMLSDTLLRTASDDTYNLCAYIYSYPP
jgi:hypothetical protein